MRMNQLLHDPALVSITLLGGRNGLDRQVNAIGLIEAPDIEEYLVPAQLLLTTGYHYYQDVAKLDHLIEAMAAHGCAGLGIKADRYFKHIPPDVIATADRVGLPLIVTPANSYLSQVVKQLTEVVINADALILSRTIEQNQQLSALGMANANYDTVLETIASWFDHEIVLLDSHFMIRHSSKALSDQRQAISKALGTCGLDYANLDHQVTVSCLQHHVTILPLMVMYPENKAFIGLFDLSTPTPVQQLQLQQIQNVLSLMNSRTDVANTSAQHMANNFFANMLHGTLTEGLLRRRLKDYDLTITQKGHCAVITVGAAVAGTLITLHQVERVFRLVTWFVTEYSLPVTVFVVDQQIVLFIQAPQAPGHLLTALHHFLVANLETKYTLSIGYSQACSAIKELPALYQEGVEAAHLAQQHPQTVMQFRPKKAAELLHLIPAIESRSFVQEMLGPLLTLDNHTEAQELLRTLRLYLYHNLQINAVAKDLFIHRNTVTYRLQKIKQILKVDFQDPVSNERLNLALMLQDQ
ncbi:PucR family transcriptional regulator [Lacticaseibacillus sp. GG6-2]